jgi:single-strand DNA-binding protein
MPNLLMMQAMGHLGRDPEMKDAGGHEVAKFSIACNNPRRKDDDPIWLNVSVFGRQGQACMDYLKKGRPVFVSGSFWPREYESQGETRVSYDVNADVVQFLGSKGDNAGGGSEAGQRRSNEGPNPHEDDPIPF